jgi:stress-induced morphogen
MAASLKMGWFVSYSDWQQGRCRGVIGMNVKNFDNLPVQDEGSAWSWLACTTTMLKSTNEEAHCVSQLISARVLKTLLELIPVITPDVLAEYIRKSLPDAEVTVTDRTGTMNHLKVVIVSDGFEGKNLLDRHRLIYQALDAPMKDGRIHALELTARTKNET